MKGAVGPGVVRVHSPDGLPKESVFVALFLQCDCYTAVTVNCWGSEGPS